MTRVGGCERAPEARADTVPCGTRTTEFLSENGLDPFDQIGFACSDRSALTLDPERL